MFHRVAVQLGAETKRLATRLGKPTLRYPNLGTAMHILVMLIQYTPIDRDWSEGGSTAGPYVDKYLVQGNRRRLGYGIHDQTSIWKKR